MEEYNWDTVINFGKYKFENVTVKEVYENGDINYLIWCLSTADHVCFSDVVFSTIINSDFASSNESINDLLDNTFNTVSKVKKNKLFELEIIHLRKKLKLNNIL